MLGRGRFPGGTRRGTGPGGYCVCPSCKTRIPHITASPCYQQKCPKCGAFMVRE